MRYKYVPRTKKRKRGGKSSSDASSAQADRFNTTARCSLKELALCIALLKDRHLQQLVTGGLGHLKDFRIKENINRRLICFLMYRIDPETMILDLGDGSKKLQITADAMHKLFGLPRGNKSPPRPSENGYDKALMVLKAELGIPRNQHINTKDLRSLLKRYVDDPSNDAMAMKVFGLILYNKFICPGYSTRINREAPMVEDFDATKLKEYDLCQLLVDELKRAVIAWQNTDSDWKSIPGCCIAPLLMYLDCIDDRKHNPVDKRCPRALYMDPVLLRKVADLDCIKKGNEFPDTWIYGKLPVR